MITIIFIRQDFRRITTTYIYIYIYIYISSSSSFVVYLCCSSFTGPHYRSSYTCSQPQQTARRSYQLHSGFNHSGFNYAPPPPSHHSPLSVDPSHKYQTSQQNPFLRSSALCLSLPPVSTRLKFGDRSFRNFSPRLWNSTNKSKILRSGHTPLYYSLQLYSFPPL